MGSRDWIRNMVNGGTPIDWLKSREAYDQYKKDTGSHASYKTYRRTILKVLSQGSKPVAEEEPGSTFEENGNYAHAKYVGDDRIKTLDDLVRVCNIDLDVWKIDNVKYNKWEGYRSGKTVNMTYNDGVGSGEIKDDGGLTIEPLFKVEAWCSKKVMEPLNLKPVSPVKIAFPSKPSVKRIARAEGLKRAMILSDAQMAYSRDIKTGKYTPFHDRQVFDLAEQIAEKAQPEIIIWNGDFFDLPDWSDKFLSEPDFYYTLQPALV